MSFSDAIRLLNLLKRRKIIKDYVLFGAIAATAYMEPIFTEDLDIIVGVESDEEYIRTFRRVAEFAEAHEGMHHVLGGLPVQMFPSTTSALYRDALEKARAARIGGLRVKVASPEHLTLLYLESFREKDHFRISQLLTLVDEDVVSALLQEFDDEEHTLACRLQRIR